MQAQTVFTRSIYLPDEVDRGSTRYHDGQTYRLRLAAQNKLILK